MAEHCCFLPGRMGRIPTCTTAGKGLCLDLELDVGQKTG